MGKPELSVYLATKVVMNNGTCNQSINTIMWDCTTIYLVTFLPIMKLSPRSFMIGKIYFRS